MMLLDGSGRLFGRWNVIDASILTVAFLIVLGILLVQAGVQVTSSQVVKGESDIVYTILLRRVRTLQPNLFRPDQAVHMTIRNQPRGHVKVLDSVSSQSLTLIPSGSSAKAVPDLSDPNSYDYTVRLKDHATITSDGYVTEGVKLKIGMTLEVEGPNFRLPGQIIAIEEVSDAASSSTAAKPAAAAH